MRAFLALHVLQLLYSMGFNLVFRLIPAFLKGLGYSSLEISLIHTAYNASSLLKIPCGWVADRIGKVPTLLIVFSSLIAISVAFLFSQSILWYALLFLLVGIVGGFYYNSINALVTILHDKKTEGLFRLESMYQLGALVGPVAGGVLVSGYGIQAAFLVWLAIAVIGFAITFGLRKMKESKSGKAHMLLLRQMGLRKLSFMIFLVVGAMLAGLFQGAMDLAIPIYAVQLGMSMVEVGIILGVSSVIAFLGLPYLGRRFEKMEGPIPLIVTISLMAVAFLLMIFLPFFIPLILLLGIFNLGRAGGLNVTRAFVSGTMAAEARATAIAMTDTMLYIGRVIGALAAGLMMDAAGASALFGAGFWISVVGIAVLIVYRLKV